MTEQEFANIVIMEVRLRSMMTYVLTKRQHRRFKRFFLRKAKRHLNWGPKLSAYEFERFSKAFNVKIK